MPAETAGKAKLASFVYLQAANVTQASLGGSIDIIGVNLHKVLFFPRKGVIRPPRTRSVPSNTMNKVILGDVYNLAIRAFIIAASGHHNILLTGSSGISKAIRAKPLTSPLLVPSSDEQMVAIKLYSLTGELTEGTVPDTHLPPPHSSQVI